MTTPEGPDRPPSFADPDEPEDDASVAPPPPKSRFAAISADRYLPIVAIIAMVATYLQVRPDFALVLIGGVWLVVTRITRNHRFLGLTLTEGLAWAATVLIFLILILGLVGSVQVPA